jgi:hypothetical protein
MSVKGSSASWFEAAVRRGDLVGALGEVPALPRPLSLAYMLAIVVLMGEQGDACHPRAAARWAARLSLDRETVTLPHLAVVVRVLAQLDEDRARARRGLIDIARQHDVPGVDRLLGAGRSRPSSAVR